MWLLAAIGDSIELRVKRIWRLSLTLSSTITFADYCILEIRHKEREMNETFPTPKEVLMKKTATLLTVHFGTMS